MAVDQSRTEWVKKGQIVNGVAVKKGYLAQKGKPEKRVTAAVNIQTATESGKKAGEVYKYKAGRTVKQMPAAAGAGTRGGSKPSATPTPKKNNGGAGNGGGNKNADAAKTYQARVKAQRAAANKAGASRYGTNKAPMVRATASGTPLLGTESRTGGTDRRAEKVSVSGLPRGSVKPKTFANKPAPTRGEKRSFSGIVKVWNGTGWVPFKK